MLAFVKKTPLPGSKVGKAYSLSVSSLSSAQHERERGALTIQASVGGYGPPPAPFCAYTEQDGRLLVPRFYGLERFGEAEVDERTLGCEIGATFTSEPSKRLTQVQEKAATQLLAGPLSETGVGGCIVCLPCGMGKTVLAVYLICKLGRRACVLVHKEVIREQWIKAFSTFAPGVKVGTVQGKKWIDVEGADVVVAMVMTVARMEESFLFSTFGTLMVDECHHMAAPVMNLAAGRFGARYVVGLSATVERADGLTPLLHWCLGKEAFRAERNSSEQVKVSILLFRGGTPEIRTKNRETPMIMNMITKLASHTRRNAFMASWIVRRRGTGRVVLFLSDRHAQLVAMQSLLSSLGLEEDEVGMYTGHTPDAHRASELRKPVVLCTYQMANEGLDKTEADTVVMGTPKANVVQCIGRIQRPCNTKQPPLVLDVADCVSVFVQMRFKRQRLYSKEKYEVQVLEETSAEGSFFT